MIDLRPDAGPALIVGGGAVATRKAKGLAEAEFRMTVIAPVIDEAIRALPWVTVVERAFEADDLPLDANYSLVFACTASRAINREVGRLARAARIPVVVADSQPESTFFTPAVIRDGDLAIAVSTGGASPTLARSIREQIVTALGPGWDTVVRLARAERQKRLGAKSPRPQDDA